MNVPNGSATPINMGDARPPQEPWELEQKETKRTKGQVKKWKPNEPGRCPALPSLGSEIWRNIRSNRSLRSTLGWATVLSMRTRLLFVVAGAASWFAATTGLRADVLEMQNGDRYSGKVLSVSADTVVLNSEILGKINVPRAKVTVLKFGTGASGGQLTAASSGPLPVKSPAVAVPIVVVNTNANLAASFNQLGGDTNVIGQIRGQMLAGSPEASGKFDEMVGQLMSGQMSIGDLRKQAQESAAQLRGLQREMGPQRDETLDEYLKILDAFVSETAAEPGNKSN